MAQRPFLKGIGVEVPSEAPPPGGSFGDFQAAMRVIVSRVRDFVIAVIPRLVYLLEDGRVRDQNFLHPDMKTGRFGKIATGTKGGAGNIATWDVNGDLADGGSTVALLSNSNATLIQDADLDTKIQVEESADEDKIRFDTGGTERVVIDSTGVGIGIEPSRLLTLKDDRPKQLFRHDPSGEIVDGATLADIEFGGIDTDVTNILSAAIRARAGEAWGVGATGTGLDFWTTPVGSTTLTRRMDITADGNVGIGNSSPTYLLDAYTASGNAVARLQSAGTNSLAILRFQNDAQTWWSGVAGNDQFRIVDVTGGSTIPFAIIAGAPTNAMAIASDGKVGIGTASPASELDVQGEAQADFFAPQNAIFHAYDSAGGTDLGTSWTAITWDTEVVKHSNYTHSADGSGITVGATGTYRVTVDLTATNAHASARYHADWRLYHVTDAAAIVGSTRKTYHRWSTDPGTSCSITRILALDASDEIRVEGQTNDTGSDVTTLADGCAITIERIG